MGTRTERVIFKATDADYTSTVARMAAETALLDKALNNLSGSYGRSTAAQDRNTASIRDNRDALRDHRDAMRDTESGMQRVERQVARSGNVFDRASGRLRLYAEAAVTLGTAVAPVAAVSVPALIALTTQMGFAVAGAGATILAFRGIGDTMKALNEYGLDPSADNMAKVREQMSKLGPEARDFAFQLRGLADEGKSLQDAAAAGALPGFGDALEILASNRLGEGRLILHDIADTMGDIARQSANSFASGRWDRFFDYVQSDQRRVLQDLGRATGDLVHGTSELLVAFGPLTRDFGDGLEGLMDRYDKWATNLDSTDGFYRFGEYVREQGPEVIETIGDITGALVDIGEAAAPVGDVTLDLLQGIADATSAIAGSDFGGPIIAGTAALIAFNRGLRVAAATARGLNLTMAGRGAGMVTGGGVAGTSAGGVARAPGLFGPMIAGASVARTSLGQLRGDMRTLGMSTARAFSPTVLSSMRAVEQQAVNTARTAGRELAAFQTRVASGEEQIRRNMGGGFTRGTIGSETARLTRQYETATARANEVAAANGRAAESIGRYRQYAGQGAAAAAAVALSMSDLGDKTNYANTAQGALLGTLIAPGIGTAVGSLVGLTLDYAHATDDLQDATVRAQAAMDTLDYSGIVQGQKDVNKQLADVDEYDIFGMDYGPEWYQKLLATNPLMGGLTDIKSALANNPGAELFGFGGKNDAVDAANQIELVKSAYDELLHTVTASDAQMPNALTNTQNALRGLGVTKDDLAGMAGDEAAIAALAQRTQDYTAQADSASGRTKAFVTSLRDLNDAGLTVSQTAPAFTSALQAMIMPALSAQQAADKFRASLLTMKDSLKDLPKTLEGDAGIGARTVVGNSVGLLMDEMSKMADNNAGAGAIARKFAQGRAELLEFGEAAGISRKEMSKFLNTIGLTPKRVETAVGVTGVGKAIAQTNKAYGMLKKYGATRANALALVRDLASGKIRNAQDLADKFDITKAQATALLRDLANGKLRGLINLMDQVDGRNTHSTSTHDIITNYITRRTNEVDSGFGPQGGASAEGNLFASVYRHGGLVRHPFDRRNDHPAHMAPAGAYRIFAEAETGGEAYIPLRNDYRRPRAEAILREVAAQFGMRVIHAAEGQMLRQFGTHTVNPAARYQTSSGAGIAAMHVTFSPLHGSFDVGGGQRLTLEALVEKVANRVVSTRNKDAWVARGARA